MLKKSILIILTALSISTVSAGPYVEVGLGTQLGSVTQNNGCISDWKEKTNSYGCSSNPFGIVAVGYQHSGFSIQVEHTSSLQEKDRGLNMMSVKYRYDFYE